MSKIVTRDALITFDVPSPLACFWQAQELEVSNDLLFLEETLHMEQLISTDGEHNDTSCHTIEEHLLVDFLVNSSQVILPEADLFQVGHQFAELVVQVFKLSLDVRELALLLVFEVISSHCSFQNLERHLSLLLGIPPAFWDVREAHLILHVAMPACTVIISFIIVVVILVVAATSGWCSETEPPVRNSRLLVDGLSVLIDHRKIYRHFALSSSH
mmetsp:Transcript_38710/g.152871  ORF Transcript_38710/g.152871 Transcript_38710/m.152871 type:complete len:215 (-) Transcript_38710:545-1189(-)